MNSIICKVCNGNVIPIQPFKAKQWKCEVCTKLVSSKDVGNVFSLIGSILRGLDDADFSLIYRFLSKKLINLVPESHETSVELKYRIVWMLGYSSGYTWTGIHRREKMHNNYKLLIMISELGDDLINIKIKYSNDILTILQKLDTGQCKMRGLLLYELFQCYEELKRRKKNVSLQVVV